MSLIGSIKENIDVFNYIRVKYFYPIIATITQVKAVRLAEYIYNAYYRVRITYQAYIVDIY